MSPQDLGSDSAVPAHTGAPPKPVNRLITGGGRGLGEAMAYAFAKAGASDMVQAARTTTELDAVASNLRASHPDIIVSTVKCDVTSEADVLKLVDVLKTSHSSRLDVLINNAGSVDAGWQPITAETAPASEWKKVFDVNVYGVYLVTRHLLPLLLETPAGLKTVLGIGGMSSYFASPSIAMGMSKLAMNRFIEFLAATYEAEGLISYALRPGNVKTRMSTDPQRVPPELSKKCIDSPDLLGGMAVWLSKESRPWLNGRYVAANWDVDELLGRKDEIAKSDMFKIRMVV